MLDATFFKKYGPELVACFRRAIFDPDGHGKKARDVYGKPYDKYSPEYAKSKRGGKMFKQASRFKDSKAPVLSSDLALDFKWRGLISTGFKFGTLAHGGKVDHLAKLGRVISSDSKPIPDKCSKMFMNLADKYVKRELKKTKGQTINIKM